MAGRHGPWTTIIVLTGYGSMRRQRRRPRQGSVRQSINNAPLFGGLLEEEERPLQMRA